MSGFLGDFLTKAKDVTDAAGKKTDEYYRLSRLKLRTVQLRGDIRNRYEVLGMRVYEMYRTGLEDTGELLAMADEIEALRAKLDENEDRIMELTGCINCPVCGERNKIKSLYCNSCGHKFVVTDEAVEENENQTPIFNVD